MIALPPRGGLAGFRDPYIFARGGGGRPWKMLLGSGAPGRGGTLLVYHAPSLTSGAPGSIRQPQVWFGRCCGGCCRAQRAGMLLVSRAPMLTFCLGVDRHTDLLFTCGF